MGHSAQFWRDWEGRAYVERTFEVAALADHQPKFGRMSRVVRATLGETFTPEDIARLRFYAWLAASYEINEGA